MDKGANNQSTIANEKGRVFGTSEHSEHSEDELNRRKRAKRTIATISGAHACSSAVEYEFNRMKIEHFEHSEHSEDELNEQRVEDEFNRTKIKDEAKENCENYCIFLRNESHTLPEMIKDRIEKAIWTTLSWLRTHPAEKDEIDDKYAELEGWVTSIVDDYQAELEG